MIGRLAGAVVDEQQISFVDYAHARGEGLMRLAWLVTRNWDDARDAVQDAYAALLPRWSSLPAGDRREAYVSRCVVNAALAVARRRSRSTPVADVAVLVPERTATPDPASSAATTVLLWQLCGELPPVQRAAVALRFYQDRSYAEIGEALGCPEVTARSHVRRAVSAMRRRVGQEDGQDG